MRHLDQNVLPDAFKYAVLGLLLLCPICYCVCLLVPHSDTEPMSKSMSRALQVGAVKGQFYRAQRHLQAAGGSALGSALGAWTAVSSVVALLVFWLVLDMAGVWLEREVDRDCVNVTITSAEQISCRAH